LVYFSIGRNCTSNFWGHRISAELDLMLKSSWPQIQELIEPFLSRSQFAHIAMYGQVSFIDNDDAMVDLVTFHHLNSKCL
jgi:hypothetical protein